MLILVVNGDGADMCDCSTYGMDLCVEWRGVAWVYAGEGSARLEGSGIWWFVRFLAEYKLTWARQVRCWCSLALVYAADACLDIFCEPCFGYVRAVCTFLDRVVWAYIMLLWAPVIPSGLDGWRYSSSDCEVM